MKLFLLYFQDGPFSLVWMLKPFDSKLIVLPMPGLLWTGTVRSFFQTATTASVGSAAPWAASQPSQHTYVFQCFPFSLRCSISFNFTQHFPLSYCWQEIHVVTQLCSDGAFQANPSLQHKTLKTFLILNAQSSAQLALFWAVQTKKHFEDRKCREGSF